MDFFTVPTAPFRVLFVLVILSPDRRRIVHLNVTDHPTAAWTRQQIREAFPDQTAPRYLGGIETAATDLTSVACYRVLARRKS